MSFDLTQSIDITDTVQYNYSPTMFYKSQYQSTCKSTGYIKTPFTSISNRPNIALFGSGYITTTLYITAPIHSIDYLEYDAELIIEHRSLTNYSHPLYTCFLLKMGGPYTNIDALIEGKDVELDLNALLKPQKTIVFDDQSVIIFTSPIAIQSSLTRLKRGPPLIPYVNDYSILRAKPILGEPLIEGLADSGIPDPPILDPSQMPDVTSMTNIGGTTTDKSAILASMKPNTKTNDSNVTIAGYCQPIDETDPSIQQSAGVIVPLESKLTSNKAADTTIKTLMNFFGFFIMVISAVFIAPVVHRIFIIELILDNIQFSAQRKLNRTNAADFYTGAVIFGLAIALINYGIINNIPFSTILGFYLFLFLMTSVIVLQYQRIFNPNSYLEQFKDKRGVLPSFENMEMDWGFYSDNLGGLFWRQAPDPDNPGKTKGKVQLGFIFILIIYSVLMYLLRKFKITGASGKFFLTSIYFYMILFTIYLIQLLGHYSTMKERMNQQA